MNRTNTYDFLSTFGAEAQAATPEIPVTPAPVVAAPAAQLSTANIIDLAAATAARTVAQQQLTAVKAAAPAPAAPVDEDGDLKKMISKLTRDNAATNARLEAIQLENYRVNAIANALASGAQLIEQLVGGNSPQEIDASIPYAKAEYELVRQRVLQTQQIAAPAVAPAPVVAPTPVDVPAPVLQGSVAAVAAPAPNATPQQGAGYVNAPSAGDAPANNGLTSEQLAYLVSPTSVRNGHYAQFRDVIIHALKQASGAAGPQVPSQWSFGARAQIAPPNPHMQQGAAGMPPPAMQQNNVYTGVTMPQARPAGPTPYIPQQGMPPLGRAAQPSDLSAGVQLDVGAAIAAAEAAIAHGRKQAQR